MNVISDTVDKISPLNSEIASSFAEQNQSSKDVNQSVSRLKELTIHACEDAQGNANSSQRLSQLSEQLKINFGFIQVIILNKVSNHVKQHIDFSHYQRMICGIIQYSI